MKSILVNLKNEKDLYQKYNDELSDDLINYLINEARTKDNIEIIVNTNLEIDNIVAFIKDGLQKTYNKYRRADKIYDNKQLFLFIIGVVIIIFSTLIDYEVIKEIVIIAGWFYIWEAVDIAINIESEYKMKRKVIKKLLNSKIKVNKI